MMPLGLVSQANRQLRTVTQQSRKSFWTHRLLAHRFSGNCCWGTVKHQVPMYPKGVPKHSIWHLSRVFYSLPGRPMAGIPKRLFILPQA